MTAVTPGSPLMLAFRRYLPPGKDSAAQAEVSAEQQAAIEFLNQIVHPERDQAFVIGFDTTPEITQDFTNNPEKLAAGVRLLRPGGVVAFDNALWHGRVPDSSARDPETVAVRELLKQR